MAAEVKKRSGALIPEVQPDKVTEQSAQQDKLFNVVQQAVDAARHNASVAAPSSPSKSNIQAILDKLSPKSRKEDLKLAEGNSALLEEKESPRTAAAARMKRILTIGSSALPAPRKLDLNQAVDSPLHRVDSTHALKSLLTVQPMTLRPRPVHYARGNSALLEEKESPRTAAAAEMKRISTIGSSALPPPRINQAVDFPLHRVDSTHALKSLLTVQPMTLRPRPVHYASLEALLDGCRNDFAQYAGDIAKKEIAQGAFLPRGFLALKDLLLSVENREFLDAYIVRNSGLAAVQDSAMQEKFAAFDAKIADLKATLRTIGIEAVEPGHAINFWSGQEGQLMAAADSAMSDSDVPLLKFLFTCWDCIKKKNLESVPAETVGSSASAAMPAGVASELISLLPILFSAIFASYAEGEVNVYMASKNDGDHTVVNINSAFWSAELYALVNNPRVAKVNLVLHQGKGPKGEDKWAPPIDLKSNDPKIIAYRDQVVCISVRGDASLRVPMATLKDKIATWSKAARAAQFVGFEESEC